MKEVDPIALDEALHRFGLLPCVHFPVAARDRPSLEKYVGKIEAELSRKNSEKAFLVSVIASCEKDMRLPIWQLERAAVIQRELQVWVHVDYNNYRRAYRKAFPDDVVDGMIMGHVINRNVARLKHFKYVRMLPITRAVNSSSAFSEKWAMEYHSSPEMQKRHKESAKNIQYADLSDISMMLNIMPGGGVMDAVNDAQYLVDVPIQ